MPLRPLPSAPCLRMTPDNTCHTGVARERCHRLLRLSERRSHAVFHPYPARLTSPFTSPCHRTFPQASPATGPPYHTKNATVAASSPSAAVPSEPPMFPPHQAGSPPSSHARTAFFVSFYNFRNSYTFKKMCRKYNKTQKSTKQFFIESLRVDLGIRLDQIHFCALLPSVKKITTQILKYLITKIYK
jgi:hypothetical protein